MANQRNDIINVSNIRTCFLSNTGLIDASVLFEESHFIPICVCDLIHVRILPH